MLLPSIFWLWFSGLTVLLAGLFLRRGELGAARGLDKLVELGPIFIASGIAAFGAEHLTASRSLMQIVPMWMPARLFWAYFVGFALIAAALSFILMKYVRLSATLLGCMFFLFVWMIHVPNVVTNPRNRILWVVALRDFSFAGGAWALTGGRLAIAGRFMVSIPLVVFAIESFLHPYSAPGVPLEKLTPAWAPAPALWGYVTAAFLLAGGIALLTGIRPRIVMAWTGLWLTVLVLFLYAPILAIAQPAEMLEAVNYIFDTLLFAGVVLCAAYAFGSNLRIVKS